MRLLSAIGVFTAADYRANRRLAFLIIVLAAAVLTPGPDFSSMLLLSLPMALLYELGVLLAREPAAAF
jgi:sec-independent protein translocase protein TatC